MPYEVYDQVVDQVIEIFPALVKLARWMNQPGSEGDEFAMPPAQMNTLVMLANFPQMNMTQLAEHLYMPRQQLTKIIDALEEKGLVGRKTLPQNRRYVMLELSDKGKDYIRAALNCKKGAFKRFIERMTPDQRERFSHALLNIKDVLLNVSLSD